MTSQEKRKPADLLFLGCFEKDRLAKEVNALEPDFARTAKIAIEKERFLGKPAQIFSSYAETYREAPEIVLVGLGPKKDFGALCFRKATGKMVRIAKEAKAKSHTTYKHPK